MRRVWDAAVDFFGRIFFIFRHDMQKLFTNPIAAILAVGLMILPSLYAWFNIEASWDPYGNTGNLRVAVANCDDGYTLKGIGVNVGNSIVDSLAENEEIGWLFMNREDAVNGVKSGEYYAAIVIPDDFSRDMMSVLTPDMARPSLEYYVNEKINAIAPKITGTAMSTVQQQVNASFIDRGMTVLCDTILNLYNAYADSDLSQISNVDAEAALQDTIDLLTELSANLGEMQTVLSVFDDTGETIDSLLEMLRKTIQKTEENLGNTGDTVQSVTGAADHLGDSLTNVVDSLDILMDTTSDSLDLLGNMTGDLSGVIERGGEDAASAVEDIVRVADSSADAVRQLETLCRNMAGTLRKPIDSGRITENMKVTIPDPKHPGETITLSLYDAFRNSSDSLNETASRLNRTADKLLGVCDDLDDLAAHLEDDPKAAADDLEAIRRDVKEASSLMTSAVREFDGTARNEIENCASYLADTADSLISASDDLASILPYLDITMEGGQKALDSAGDALDGTVSLIGSFDQSLGKTIENLGKLKEDVHEIQSSVNVKTVLEDALGVDLDDYAGNTQELAEFISSPVELDTQTLYPIENYGSSMTPFYTILAIWVGCLLLVSIFKVNVRQNGDLRMKRFRHYHLYGGRYLLFLTFSVIQAVVMCLGDLHILGIQCLAPGRFILTGVLAAVTFSNIVYTLTICFGDVGKAIAIVLLIIQVAGAGGTFPVELTPSFFNNLNPFMPFTHGINAMRECIGGFYGNSYLFSLIKMCVYFPIFFIFGTVFRKPLIRMMNFFHRKLDETGLM